MINILILEDDPIISLDIKAIIDDMDGFNSFIASNISDALKIAHKYILHIVLADIQIKGLIDGIDTAKTLQQLYHCQVIFLTSFNDEQTLQRASDLETSGYILKPFREDELITSVKLCSLKLNYLKKSIDVGSGYIYEQKHQQLFLNCEHIILSAKEQQLFLLLLNNRGKIVPFSYIDEVIWFDSSVTDSTRRQLLHRLRSKLDKLDFEVVKYSGYRLNF